MQVSISVILMLRHKFIHALYFVILLNGKFRNTFFSAVVLTNLWTSVPRVNHPGIISFRKFYSGYVLERIWDRIVSSQPIIYRSASHNGSYSLFSFRVSG
jgi:hypothetical protein